MGLKAVLLLLVACFCASVVSAQETTRWYYGWNPTSQEVFAYTAEGDVNTLLTGIEALEYVRRINAQNAIAALMTDSDAEAPQLYLLTPDNARLLTLTFADSVDPDDDFDYALVTYTDEYALFSSSYNFGAFFGMIADFEAGTVSLLEDFKLNGANQAHFSEDGQYLRYVGIDPDDDQKWSLIERTLANGEERIIYSGEGFPDLVGSKFGEDWIVGEVLSVDGGWVRQYVRVSAGGEREVVGVASASDLRVVTVFDSYQVTYTLGCETDCAIIVTSFEDGEEQVFQIRDSAEIIRPLALVGESRLLIFYPRDEGYYLLSEDREQELIGVYNPRNIGQPLLETLSPDGRFLLVISGEDEAAEYGVWDFEYQRFVIQDTPDTPLFAFIYYSDSGFIVSNGLVTFDLYSDAEDSVISLPEAAGICFDVLENGDVLCSIPVNDSEHPRGIYRYDPVEDVYELLVEGGVSSMR